ncbi:gustatory receptor for sugar taste 43a-like [Asbolus verrucosus]|uniref:Gustatory receptor n=1 Tax=Asbolus verrucosus TaxID=1661398 RepID=A0A482VC91_ASBVE|nr:gustatory receptor for sugar taste 43a-like [Asbolus verrucosus]
MKKSEALVTPELYHVLQPFIIVTRTFGFMPITCERKGLNYTFHWSLLYTIYSYILGAFMMFVSMNGLAEDLHASDSVRMRNSTVKYVTLVDLGEVIVTVFVGIIVTPFRLKYLWKILTCFYKIDAVIPQKLVKVERRRTIISIIIAIGCVLFVLTYELYLWGEISDKSGLLWVFMKRYFILFSTYFMVFIQEMPYWNFARLIRKRIEGLNGCLQTGLHFFKNLTKLWITPVKMKDSHKKNSGSFGILSYERVINLMKIYELINDAIDATNDFCGVSILFIMFSILLHLVVTPYFLLVEVANNGYFIFIFLQFSWTMLHCGRLIVLVETCQYCLDENFEFQHQKTVDLVFKLLSCDLQEDVKDQLKVFALQLSGRKVKFSSFSVMKINRSLLTAIGGSVTTFLVILFQFGSVGSDVYYSRD